LLNIIDYDNINWYVYWQQPKVFINEKLSTFASDNVGIM